MDALTYCTQCGSPLEQGAAACKVCGKKIIPDEPISTAASKHTNLLANPSPKSATLTLFFALFFGILGLHRFYVGKFGTGLIMLLTLGGLGIWMLVDLIFIVNNKFEDQQGRTLQLIHKPSKVKKAFLVLGAIVSWAVVYFVTIFTLVMYLTSGLVDTINNQLVALKAGNIEQAYSYTSKDFQKATSIADFKKFIEQYPSLKDNQSSYFNERKIENFTGTVEGVLTSKDGAKTPVKYMLIKEDGTWKILNINLLPSGAGVKINDN